MGVQVKGKWRYDWKEPNRFIHWTMRLFSTVFVLFGLCMQPNMEGFLGLWKIFFTPAGLITDSIVVGGIGAAFMNAGLVMLFSTELIARTRGEFTGISVATLFLMSGFALFGKDLLNTIPILAGGFLYAKCIKEPFSKTVHITLFSTALSPMVTEFAQFYRATLPGRIGAPVLVGLCIGFVVPAVSHFTSSVHQGFNLYNVGFSSGLVGLVMVSIFKSFGFTFGMRLSWNEDYQIELMCFLGVLFGLMIGIGFCLNKGKLPPLGAIMKETGQAPSDFIALNGYPAVLVNMGLLGVAATGYVLATGCPLNGPTIGGILTVCGFGAFGKHLLNVSPVVFGLVGFSLLCGLQLSDPTLILAGLFSTGLAPVSGKYGPFWGMVAGAIHSSVVMNVGMLHGGLNLYNNGFAAGLVCIVLIPMIEYCREMYQKWTGKQDSSGQDLDELMDDSIVDIMEGEEEPEPIEVKS